MLGVHAPHGFGDNAHEVCFSRADVHYAANFRIGWLHVFGRLVRQVDDAAGVSLQHDAVIGQFDSLVAARIQLAAELRFQSGKLA